MTAPEAPGRDCMLCPRLAALRTANRNTLPNFFNAPVPSFGALDARVLVVGLAPGLKGANRTGRPFTGDFAGVLLYATLAQFGFADGDYGERSDDGLTLRDCRITNAVRCVPPGNKPLPAEAARCRPYLVAELAAMTRLRAIVALGSVAHVAALAASGERASRWKFAHGARHELPSGMTIFDSYHCSRYNTNTGRLTAPMFHAVFFAVRRHLDHA